MVERQVSNWHTWHKGRARIDPPFGPAKRADLPPSIAEMERDLTRERTLAALAFARRQGRVRGRKLLMTPKKTDAARKLLPIGIRPREVASAIGASAPTLYRHLLVGAGS